MTAAEMKELSIQSYPTVFSKVETQIRDAACRGWTSTIIDLGPSVQFKEQVMKDLGKVGFVISQRYSTDFYVDWGR